MAEKNGRGGNAPTIPTLDELRNARTDYKDVPVEGLGGKTLRLYGLSGTARAKLMASMLSLATHVDLDDLDVEKLAASDPELVERVFLFQTRVVAASLGYPEPEWVAVGDALGERTITELFDVATELSGLDSDAKDEAVQRLRPARNAASGTD